MSRYHRIKWRESDEKELKRVVKNFNAKLARIEKKNPHMTKNLPKFPKTIQNENGESLVTFTNRLSVDQIKELVNTRRDLEREINALKRFSRRGAEELVYLPDNDNNIQITKWQKTEISRRIKAINRKREKRLAEIESLEMKSGEEGLGYSVGEFGMGKAYKRQFSPLNAFTPSMGYADINWKFRASLKEMQHDYFDARDALLRDNYIKSITENYRNGDAREIVEKIKSMSIQEFKKIFYEQVNVFEWSYYDTEEEYQEYLNKIQSIWTPKKQNKKG